MNIKKLIPYLIVIVPLVLVLTASFFITTFYLEKVTLYFNAAKEIAHQEYINKQKNKSEMWVEQLYLLFDYKHNRIEENIEKELRIRVEIAYKTAKYIYEKYEKTKSKKEIQARIVDALSHMQSANTQAYIFITDYKGDSILLGNQNLDDKSFNTYVDAHSRAIVLEQIQKVRKYKEGLLFSQNSNDNEEEVIFVKDLGIYDWYIGSVLKIKIKEEILKEQLVDMVESIPSEHSSFIALYDKNENIFVSKSLKENASEKELDKIQGVLNKESNWHTNIVKKHYFYNKYFHSLEWNIVYGFDISSMNSTESQKQKKLENMLEEEFDFIIKASATIVFFVVILSLILSRKVNQIFRSYQDEVRQRRAELEDLNSSLEKKVFEQIQNHRQKDKILIQQSKMAEMGDMLNMIAHQWRQPLNQVSYILMNIESAYEYKELNKTYLDEKVTQANEQISFMSTTIDDFRNYFRPQKEKQFVLVSDVVQSSISLMKHTLEEHNIEVEVLSEGRELTHIYKNEFLQVLLNLVKNAKDVLVQKQIAKPKIRIVSSCYKEKLLVEIFDNAGGVKEDLFEKIFEPYFSTKTKKQGTGLGLYMSKMIIEDHLYGRLSVSNTDEGACFTIEL